jgi:ATP-binding cassette subfamily B protein
MFLLGFLPVVPMYVLKLLVDAMEAGESFRAILPLVIVVGGAVLLLALFQLLGSYIKEAQSQVLSDYMQNLIHEKSLELDLSFYEGPEFFDKLHRAQEEAPFRPSQVVETVMSIFRSGISAVSIAGVLIYTLPWYTVIILALAAIPAVFVQLAAAGKFFAWRMMRTSTERHVFYLNWLITGRENAKEIRLFGLGRLFKERSRHWRDRLRREQLSLSARRSAGEFLATGFQAVVVAFLLGFFAYRSIGTSGALGNLVLLFQAIQRGQQVLGNLLRGFSQLYETKLFLAHVFDFLELQPLITANSPGLPPVDRETGIAVDRVSFTYPGTDRLVLDDVSLRVRPGEIVAVVGDNGAGKTTLIKLLCRFYDPAGGVIRLDGQDLRTLEEEALRENMTVLFQDYSNYFYSANENIWFGDVKNEIDEERITAVARQAHMHEFLSGLPQGYETVIGRWLEEGAELSGGQWKRLALARTLYRQSPFIVLDEPTEGLDPYMEASFIDDLRSLAQGRALVMVSHKIASASRADRIYVMREGRVIEQGSHAELVELGGYYAGFYRTQLRQIRSDEYA